MTFPCETKGNPQPAVFWQKEGSQVRYKFPIKFFKPFRKVIHRLFFNEDSFQKNLSLKQLLSSANILLLFCFNISIVKSTKSI